MAYLVADMMVETVCEVALLGIVFFPVWGSVAQYLAYRAVQSR